ncbi:hypothetical protein ABIA39_003384 [Nocardia sp. GAS34]|uniref:site-specific integrase n=1 Tax=unclassified Nocardia TaxID=2637762 RepID=UPI003D238AF5
MASWRVFWVLQDEVRSGVRRRGLARWEDLPARENQVGVRAGDPIFLAPDYTVDPVLGLYGQSTTFRRYTAETRRNYATDIALLLTFLSQRGRRWTEAVSRDLEDFEHWRRFAETNPGRIGGTKWDRELAAFASLYRWAVESGHVRRNPVAMKQVVGTAATHDHSPLERRDRGWSRRTSCLSRPSRCDRWTSARHRLHDQDWAGPHLHRRHHRSLEGPDRQVLRP